MNARQPRLFLLDPRAEEGATTWAKTQTIALGDLNIIPRDQHDKLFAKYAPELAGVVLYDPSRSAHYRNLAGTIAGLKGALPMTREIYERISKNNISLEILIDLTTLELTSATEIYRHLYQTWWPHCEKRIILNARPDNRGDLHHTRDIAAAVGSAIVWLDCRITEERDLMKLFYQEMKAGFAVALGWHATERSGVTTASEFGIGTLPSDHFMNGSVFAGSPPLIEIPPIPKSPELANKTYIALFISDGDNIQYTQHAMRRIWDTQKDHRGQTALTWTIAPGLVDIAPGILNYYYTTATPLDCFATGPSGMGYLMPVNTLKEPGAPLGIHTPDRDRMDGYTTLTETYLQRSGLRVMTIWDNATSSQRASYAQSCRSLIGATVQNFKDDPTVRGSIEERRLRFDKLTIPYATTYDHLIGSLRKEIRRSPNAGPRFLSYQINIWKELKPDRLNALASELQTEFPGEIEFVRADHYFHLFNSANHLPVNLCVSKSTSISPTEAIQLIDGSPSTHWVPAKGNNSDLIIDLHEIAKIHRYRLHRRPSPKLARTSFTLEYSSDQTNWEIVDKKVSDNAPLFDVEFPPLRARYLRIRSEIDTGRFSEIEIFGSH